MLRLTFCGMGGLDVDAERRLWKMGVYCWDDFRRLRRAPFSASRTRLILNDLDEAERRLALGRKGVRWFYAKTPPSQYCRLLVNFREIAVYFDVETTGLESDAQITTATFFDGVSFRTFTRGDNLNDAASYFSEIALMTTYNGTAFDAPLARREWGGDWNGVHIDLRKTLNDWGIRGGLKRAAAVLGVERREAPEISTGAEAAELWRRWTDFGDAESLDLLWRYNRDDVRTLAEIARILCDESMSGNIFYRSFS
ncbi:MAG: ribonuclease H-like domain-containing protein [Thermoguttaceae bacterium]|nr:ribonuclease H-like domain-containing protein [Thermoguttaceae bacterium]